MENLKIEYIPVSDLRPYAKNTRKHQKLDIDNIARSIDKYGMNDAIGIWGKNNTIVEGHGRFLACKQLGIDNVPVVRLDHLTDKERREYAIAHNATAELSAYDFENLGAEISELDFSDFDFHLSVIESEDKKFSEGMKRAEESEEDEEYKEFLQKFELKKTTDDCYTPENIYEVVKEWCVKQYGLEGKKIIRPFYPGGDYQNENYKKDHVVIDNPPFSIISEICRFYKDRGIDFFLFAPSLTLFSVMAGEAKYVACGVTVTYENGANVGTSFVTSLGDKKVFACPELYEAIKKENKENSRKLHKELPKYSYPNEVLTPTMLNYMAAHGASFEAKSEEVKFIRDLDAQKELDKTTYGGGFLVSELVAERKESAEKIAKENATAEKAAAEKEAEEKKDAYRWKLSDREKEIVKSLGGGAFEWQGR